VLDQQYQSDVLSNIPKFKTCKTYLKLKLKSQNIKTENREKEKKTKQKKEEYLAQPIKPAQQLGLGARPARYRFELQRGSSSSSSPPLYR
jgi:hypothetical protein